MHWMPHMQTARLAHLPTQLHHLLQVRLATTASTSAGPNTSPFPWPSHPRPTPYEIFHLSPGASQKDIKARYYDLVRFHHPDSSFTRSLSPPARHARFQAISEAYDTLRRPASSSSSSHASSYTHEMERRRRAHMSNYWRYGRPHYASAGSDPLGSGRGAPFSGPDDSWKDRLIVLFAMLSLVGGLAPALLGLSPLSPYEQRHRAAAANLAQARKDARQFAEERRRMIKDHKSTSELRRRELEEQGACQWSSRGRYKED